MSISIPSDTGGVPSRFNFFDLVDLIRAQHEYALADARSVRAERDKLRDVVEGLLAVVGKLGVDAAEVARWRQLAGLPEVPA